METYRCKSCGREYTHRCKDWWEFWYNGKSFCCGWCARMYEQGPELIKTMERLLSKLDDEGVEDLLKIMFYNVVDEDDDYRDEGEEPFDIDILDEIIEKRFGGKEGIRTWGLW